MSGILGFFVGMFLLVIIGGFLVLMIVLAFFQSFADWISSPLTRAMGNDDEKK